MDDGSPDKNDLSAVEEEEERLNRAVEENLQRVSTTKFPGDERYGMPNIFGRTFGVRASAASYAVKPDHVSPNELQDGRPVWRVEFHNIKPGTPPQGFDIAGDVVLGRSSGGPFAPDVDFDEFDALKKGVSRRHALIRPTKNRLYILDLGSTNGTMRNAVPLGKGVARPLENDDTISLGRLSFTIKMIAGPGTSPLDSAARDPIVSAKGIEGLASTAGKDTGKLPETVANSEDSETIRVDLPETHSIVVPRRRETHSLDSDEQEDEEEKEDE